MGGGDEGLRNAESLIMSLPQGVEYPQRFFARDYAGNGLEFSAPKHQASG